VQSFVASTLGKPRNIRIFATRLAGTFAELLDSSLRERELRNLRNDLFYADDPIEIALLYRSGIPTRIFDEGNSKVVEQLKNLRATVASRLESAHDLIWPTGSRAFEEASSELKKPIGASELAAGYARHLYTGSEGRRRVAEAFDLVILNGDVLNPDVFANVIALYFGGSIEAADDRDDHLAGTTCRKLVPRPAQSERSEPNRASSVGHDRATAMQSRTHHRAHCLS
jgi:hypothetical protein